jgi:hypothetical protein
VARANYEIASESGKSGSGKSGSIVTRAIAFILYPRSLTSLVRIHLVRVRLILAEFQVVV